jgi:hypothetical protein
VFQIRIGVIADPNPAFYFDADMDQGFAIKLVDFAIPTRIQIQLIKIYETLFTI